MLFDSFERYIASQFLTLPFDFFTKHRKKIFIKFNNYFILKIFTVKIHKLKYILSFLKYQSINQ